MTDLVKLAQRLHRKIKWQEVPEKVDWIDQIDLICDAIQRLYVISGRTFLYNDDKFIYDADEVAVQFADNLELDEREWVLLEAQIEFYKTVQSNVDDLESYSTDAMTVAHADKPYKNIGETLDRLEKNQNDVWVRMTRYNQLGVS